ncbi:MAG TPA: sarcosine oxidase subunit gamma family protein [Burkholderiaceae bacterium]|nr:sarcosine oxidase subunit gamma family protein [Burkholderiaceae bacterium]
MHDAILKSPLAGFLGRQTRDLQVDGRPCSLAEIPFVDMLNLRGDAQDPHFARAVLEVTGLHLPYKPNGASIDPQRQLLWLGPDEWLLKLRDRQGPAVMAALQTALHGKHSAVVDVGHGNTTLLLQGPASADLLARGCPLDLHPRVFPTGALAQSHIAKASATVLCLYAGIQYEITVRRSFADYLARWLCAAGA